MASAAAALLAVGAAVDGAEPPSGSAFLYVVLGVVFAALVVLVGHSYWVWRRARGPLRSADDAVQTLASSEPQESRRYRSA